MPLASVFPPNDFALLLVILGAPLLGAFVNGVFGKRAGDEAVSLMALTAIGVSFAASVAAFFMLRDYQRGDEVARFVWNGWDWMQVSARNDAGSVPIRIAFSIDSLSGTMALIVTGVGFLIHLYSTKYMEGDPGYARFFAYLNLFIFAMLVLILGDSLPVLFIGWEGVGLCSYLLIGFWYQNDYNAFAGKKAFIANRIGDFGLLVAMAMLVYYVGALDWTGIEGGAKNGLLTSVKLWPIGTHVPAASLLPDAAEAWLNRPRHVCAATLVGLALFLGCAGKSAQFPLYVWLPDAMAGPTPVSALIHAATMVTAGVYLACRMAGVFVLSPAAMFTIAVVGAFTAVLAATIALVQNDIKRVLAYSTVSQLGFMFLAVGVGAFTAGFFHVITHAFFKACLFLGAGSVIHAMHSRIHDTDASQDMRNMGGLRRFMPITFATFVASWAAIVAVPFTSGFFSKDEILFKAFTSRIDSPVPGGKIGSGPSAIELFQWPEGSSTILYAAGVAAALMTAFYMSRLVIGIFFGELRGWRIVKSWKAKDAHAHDDHAHGLDADADPATRVGPKPHESPWQMTAPLVILGGLAVVGGFFNAHAFLHFTPLDEWLAPVFKTAMPNVKVLEDAKALEMTLLLPGVLAFLGGVGAAYWIYLVKSGEPARQLAERFPGLHRLVYEKWHVDEFYEETVLGAVDTLADFFAWADKHIVDGIIASFTSFVIAATGTGLRYFQTGRVQAYAAVMVLGIGGLGWFVVAPHPSAKVEGNTATGAYSVSAAPGLGYRYRWDSDGDGRWDSDRYGETTRVDFKLEPNQSRKVRLEVVNAFGRVASRDIDVERPKIDKSRADGPNVVGIQQGADGQHRAVVPGTRGAQPGQAPGAPNPSDPANRVLRALGQGVGPEPAPGAPPPGVQQRPPGAQPPRAQPPGAQPLDPHGHPPGAHQ